MTRLGETKPRLGNQMEEDIPRNVYRAADGGHIAISCGSQRVFDNLTRAMDWPELARDPRFATMQRRHENRAAIDGAVAQWIAARPGADALARLEAEQVVAGRVNDIADVLADAPLACARAAFTQRRGRGAGRRCACRRRCPSCRPHPARCTGPAGASGADNDSVFGDLLGIGRRRPWRRLRDAGAI